MKITATRKLIKVGSSYAVTVPAKEVKLNNLKEGDLIDYVATPHQQAVDSHSAEVVELTQKLITRHRQALKNLSQR